MSRYDEWVELQQVLANSNLAIAARRERQPDFRVAIAQADTIVAHPGWQYFLNAIQARVEMTQASLAAYQEQLMNTEDAKVRRSINELKGELTGLKFAATLVPQIVSMGEHGQGRARGIPEGVEERADQASASGSEGPGS